MRKGKENEREQESKGRYSRTKSKSKRRSSSVAKNSKSRREGNAFEEKADSMEKDPKVKFNKVEYYIQDKLILEQASQLSFQHFLGATPIDKYEIPTIMGIYMNPSPGLTYQGSIPAIMHPEKTGLSLAANKLFVKLSMHSGRNMQYAPQDIATMVLALGQVFAMHSFVRRLFGTVNLSNWWNRMFPKAAVEAMGVDYDDFVKNYADYRTYYNNLCSIVNKVPILFNCGYLEKCATQFDFLFTDDESPLSQIYMYLPYSTWILDEKSYQGGTILATTPVCQSGVKRTFADLMVNVFRPMVDALLESSTLNLVYADLLHLAQSDPSVKFTTIDPIVDGFAVFPVHSFEALEHIHNMNVVGVPTLSALNGNFTPLNDVYPDASNNCLLYNPCVPKATVSSGMVPSTVLIDSPNPQPDAAERIELSRYIAMYTNNMPTIGGVQYCAYIITPDWYAVGLSIISTDASHPDGGWSSWTESATLPYNWVSKVSQFDWHPILKHFDPTDGSIIDVVGDLNYYTTVPVQYIERLNAVVFLGLFNMDGNNG